MIRGYFSVYIYSSNKMGKAFLFLSKANLSLIWTYKNVIHINQFIKHLGNWFYLFVFYIFILF